MDNPKSGSEKDRRKVVTFKVPRIGRRWSIEPCANGFSLLDENRNIVAVSMSDHALSQWAFDECGIWEVVHNYDLATGDDGR